MSRVQIILMAAVVLFGPGCQEPQKPGDPNRAQPSIMRAMHEAEGQRVVILPPEARYTGEGQSYSREVRHVRIFTPFGDSPGSTVGKVQAFESKRGTTPSVDLENGISIGKGGGGSLLGGGMKGGWLEQLWSDWLRPALLVYGGLVGLGFVLMLIPATSAAGKAMLRVLVSPIPVVGSVVEKVIASIQTAQVTKHFEQVVQGIDDWVGQNPEQKQALYAALAAKQDADTQAAVKAAKA